MSRVLGKKRVKNYASVVMAETNCVFAIPNWLFEEAKYRSLSFDARIVYAMLLYRRNPDILKGYAVIGETLPIENSLNESINTVKFMLNCGKNTAKKVISELVAGDLVTAETVSGV